MNIVFVSAMNNQSNDLSSKAVDGGWVQINNTIVPYIYREDKKYVPLSVIRYVISVFFKHSYIFHWIVKQLNIQHILPV